MEAAAPNGDVDPTALAGWMSRYIPGFRGPLQLERFPKGRSNPTFRVAAESGSFVLRRKPPGPLLPSAHAIEREFVLLEAIHPTGFPVPRPCALCLDETVIGSTFYLMQFVEGDQFGDEEVGRLPLDRRRDIYYAAVETLARLHVIEPSAVGLETFGPPGNYLERQVRRWIGQYRASQTDILEPAERLIAWLPSAVPRQTARKIVHGDFRFENMIFESGTPRIAAILDWELSTIGDPIADLAFFALNWVTPEEGPGSLRGLDLRRLGIPSLDDILATYCRSAGIEDIPELEWYFAFNCFRLMAIIAGIKQRFSQRQIESDLVHSTIARMMPLAEAGWHFARLAGAGVISASSA